jgi:hypothetical protein
LAPAVRTQSVLVHSFLRAAAVHSTADFADNLVDWHGQFEALSAVAVRCLSANAAARPSAEEVATALRRICDAMPAASSPAAGALRAVTPAAHALVERRAEGASGDSSVLATAVAPVGAAAAALGRSDVAADAIRQQQQLYIFDFDETILRIHAHGLGVSVVRTCVH